MQKLFNHHSAHSAGEYVYYHPEDGKFVPELFPEPGLIKVRTDGLIDAEFDGEPWFGWGAGTMGSSDESCDGN